MKGPQHGLFPVNFDKFLRFLPEHPQANTFLPFRPLCNLLSKQLQYFSYYIATVAFAQPYENNKTPYNQWFRAVLFNQLIIKKIEYS